jgi:hypothetical protein
VGSFIFILAQLLLLVDFSHAWASSWMGKVEDGHRTYLFGLRLVYDQTNPPKLSLGLVGVSLLLYSVSLVMIVIMFVYYTKSDDGSSCGTNKLFISLNLVIAVVCTVMAILPRIQEGLLLACCWLFSIDDIIRLLLSLGLILFSQLSLRPASVWHRDAVHDLSHVVCGLQHQWSAVRHACHPTHPPARHVQAGVCC